MIARVLLLSSFLTAVPLMAQDYYPRHNITFGAGAGLPHSDLKRFMTNSPGINISYGYRFSRYFQADLGLNMVFKAANVRDYVDTQIGTAAINDREYMMPFGGRAILPAAGGRVLFGAGGGGTWLRYNERVSQPSSYYRIPCPYCTSRSGWGTYALGNFSYFLDSNKHFRVGATGQWIRGHTDGQALGNVPGTRTTDRWTNIFGEIGFSF